ncbi:MAG TPA: hypothetical protein VFE37_05205 [Chloroflexota bacterium]|nr:hypothetical protein [Chloroflexota bacterium]
MENAPPPPPELEMLMEMLKRAETPEARQRAWDQLVRYQRERGVRAQPRGAPEPPQA